MFGFGLAGQGSLQEQFFKVEGLAEISEAGVEIRTLPLKGGKVVINGRLIGMVGGHDRERFAQERLGLLRLIEPQIQIGAVIETDHVQGMASIELVLNNLVGSLEQG